LDPGTLEQLESKQRDPALQQQIIDDFIRESFPLYGSLRRPAVDPLSNSYYRTAQVWQPPRDPLAIDLDGDGIETLGIPTTGSPVLFDHNADGVRTGTGWLNGDDAWFVLDRDGNATIDSGRELFGVDSLITVTETIQSSSGGTSEHTYTRNARSGFEALRTLDSNADGKFDTAETAYSQVRLWQDIDSDGVSDAGDLSTLADKGIASINLVKRVRFRLRAPHERQDK
jgi:hypothetical protein